MESGQSQAPGHRGHGEGQRDTGKWALKRSMVPVQLPIKTGVCPTWVRHSSDTSPTDVRRRSDIGRTCVGLVSEECGSYVIRGVFKKVCQAASLRESPGGRGPEGLSR